jgi:hypothetical protein
MDELNLVKLARVAAWESHECYMPGDKDMDEATRHHVEEGGLGICRRCGAAECELSERLCVTSEGTQP